MFKKALAKDFRLYFVHEYIRKGDCHFRAHVQNTGLLHHHGHWDEP